MDEILQQLQLPQPAKGPKRVRAPPKRRNMDQRRLLAKFASRERRNAESDLVKSLGQALAIYQHQPDKQQKELLALDKPSILRLAVTALKLRSLFGEGGDGDGGASGNGPGPETEPASTQDSNNLDLAPIARHHSHPFIGYELEDLLHDGFLVVLAASGAILYISDSISDCLGLNSLEVTGKSMYEYVDPTDWADLIQLLAVHRSRTSPTDAIVGARPQPRAAMMRLKCTLRPTGGGIPSAGTRSGSSSTTAVYFSGNVYPFGPAAVDKLDAKAACFVGVGHRIPHPADNDYLYPYISTRIITTFRSADNLRFLRTDQNVELHLHYTPLELTRMSWFELVHAEDAYMVCQRAREVHAKGQAHSEPFRLLVKGGGWVWVIAEAFTLFQGSSSGSNSHRRAVGSGGQLSGIYCRYIVISEVQNRETRLSLHQLSLEDVGAEAARVEEVSVDMEELPSLTAVDGGAGATFDDCDDEDLRLLSSLTADVDFSSLPQFVQALEELFAEELNSPDDSSLRPSRPSSWSLSSSGSSISSPEAESDSFSNANYFSPNTALFPTFEDDLMSE